MKVDALGVPDEVANGLLDAGSPRGTLMWTPLQYASALGDEELTRELLADKKSDANERGRTKFGYAPLHVAVRFGHESIVDLLLTEGKGAMPVDDAVGANPLHVAVVQGDLAMVKKLLVFTQQMPTTKKGTTPYELAMRLGHVEIAQVLRNHARQLEHKQQLGDWLASIGMMQYAPMLHAAGFDDAQFLLANGLSDATLEAFKIEKEGHRLKLQSLYMLKEFLQGQEGVDEDEEEEEEGEEEASDTSGEEGSEVPLEDESDSSDADDD